MSNEKTDFDKANQSRVEYLLDTNDYPDRLSLVLAFHQIPTDGIENTLLNKVLAKISDQFTALIAGDNKLLSFDQILFLVKCTYHIDNNLNTQIDEVGKFSEAVKSKTNEKLLEYQKEEDMWKLFSFGKFQDKDFKDKMNLDMMYHDIDRTPEMEQIYDELIDNRISMAKLALENFHNVITYRLMTFVSLYNFEMIERDKYKIQFKSSREPFALLAPAKGPERCREKAWEAIKGTSEGSSQPLLKDINRFTVIFDDVVGNLEFMGYFISQCENAEAVFGFFEAQGVILDNMKGLNVMSGKQSKMLNRNFDKTFGKIIEIKNLYDPKSNLTDLNEQEKDSDDTRIIKMYHKDVMKKVKKEAIAEYKDIKIIFEYVFNGHKILTEMQLLLRNQMVAKEQMHKIYEIQRIKTTLYETVINYGKSVVPINSKIKENNLKDNNFHSIELHKESIAFFPLQINDKKNVEVILNFKFKANTQIQFIFYHKLMNKEEYHTIFDHFKSKNKAIDIPEDLKNVLLICNQTQNQSNKILNSLQNTDTSNTPTNQMTQYEKTHDWLKSDLSNIEEISQDEIIIKNDRSKNKIHIAADSKKLFTVDMNETKNQQIYIYNSSGHSVMTIKDLYSFTNIQTVKQEDYTDQIDNDFQTLLNDIADQIKQEAESFINETLYLLKQDPNKFKNLIEKGVQHQNKILKKIFSHFDKVFSQKNNIEPESMAKYQQCILAFRTKMIEVFNDVFESILKIISDNIESIIKFICMHLQTIINITFGNQSFLKEFFNKMDEDNSESIDKNEFTNSFIKTLFRSSDHSDFRQLSRSIIENQVKQENNPEYFYQRLSQQKQNQSQMLLTSTYDKSNRNKTVLNNLIAFKNIMLTLCEFTNYQIEQKIKSNLLKPLYFEEFLKTYFDNLESIFTNSKYYKEIKSLLKEMVNEIYIAYDLKHNDSLDSTQFVLQMLEFSEGLSLNLYEIAFKGLSVKFLKIINDHKENYIDYLITGIFDKIVGDNYENPDEAQNILLKKSSNIGVFAVSEYENIQNKIKLIDPAEIIEDNSEIEALSNLFKRSSFVQNCIILQDNDKCQKNNYQLALESDNSSNEQEMLNTVVRKIVNLLEQLLAELLDIINNQNLDNLEQSITSLASKVCSTGREILDMIYENKEEMQAEQYKKWAKDILNQVLVHGGEVVQKVLQVLARFIKTNLKGKLAFFAHLISNKQCDKLVKSIQIESNDLTITQNEFIQDIENVLTKIIDQLKLKQQDENEIYDDDVSDQNDQFAKSVQGIFVDIPSENLIDFEKQAKDLCNAGEEGSQHLDDKKDNPIDVLGKQVLSLIVKEIRKIVQKLFVTLGYTSMLDLDTNQKIFTSLCNNIGVQISLLVHKFKIQHQSSLMEYFIKQKNENDQFGDKDILKMIKELCAFVKNNIQDILLKLVDYVCDSAEIMGKAVVERLILEIPVEFIDNPSKLIEINLNGEPLINPKIQINELEAQIPEILSTLPIDCIRINILKWRHWDSIYKECKVGLDEKHTVMKEIDFTSHLKVVNQHNFN